MLNPFKLIGLVFCDNIRRDKYNTIGIRNTLSDLYKKKSLILRKEECHKKGGNTKEYEAIMELIDDFETRLKYAEFIDRHDSGISVIIIIIILALAIGASLAIFVPLAIHENTHPEVYATYVDPDSGATYIKLGDTWVPKFDSDGNIVITEIDNDT